MAVCGDNNDDGGNNKVRAEPVAAAALARNVFTANSWLTDSSSLEQGGHTHNHTHARSHQLDAKRGGDTMIVE